MKEDNIINGKIDIKIEEIKKNNIVEKKRCKIRRNNRKNYI